MIIVMRLAALMLGLTLLASCGEGYAVHPARLSLNGATEASRRDLQAATSAFLTQEGFEDLGGEDEMIALLRRGSAPATTNTALIDHLSRKHTYLAKDRDLYVEVLDYADGRSSTMMPDDPRRTPNFIQINISELRPGGMSPEGRQFYGAFLRRLEARFGEAIVVIEGPPPNDEGEYQRITWTNRVASVLVWCVAFFLGSVIIGSATLYGLGKTRLAAWPRRLIFTGLNTWLAAPILTPAASLLVIPAPNLIAFPWTNPEVYTRAMPFHPISFACAFVLSAAMAMALIKAKR